MSSEDMKEKSRMVIVNKSLFSKVKTDVYFGGRFQCNHVFIILTTGVVLHNAHVTKIDTVEQAAKALEPLAGKLAYLLFTVGIIGTGFLAIPVLTGSISYMIGESFNSQVGLEKKFGRAKAFYVTIIISLGIGLALNFIGVSPIQALIYSAILYGLTAPVMIVMLLHIANNKNVMGKFTNGRRSNVLGGLALVLMTLSAVALVYFQFK